MKCNERTLWCAGFTWEGKLLVTTVTCEISTKRARITSRGHDDVREIIGFSSQLEIGSDGYWRTARGGILRGNREEALTELAKRLDEAADSLREQLALSLKNKATVMEALKP